jgi:signal transduction histidine kinase
VLCQLIHILSSTTLIPAELTPRQTTILFLFPITIVICIIAATLTVATLRRLRYQHARAEQLAGNLSQIREEARRRTNFLNAISHDLRTPLNGITLQTYIIEQALANKDTSTVSTAVDNIRTSSTLAAEVLDALLQYAHSDLDQNVIAPVNLKDLIQGTADPFRAAAEEKGIAFALNLPDDLTLQTDSAKLERILANLLDNAVKFTARGSVSLSATTNSPSSVHNSQSQKSPTENGHPTPNNSVTITIQDTGCGIPNQHQSRLFKEFFQANNPSRDPRLGLGLGLVIAQRLTHQLSGNLTCTTTPDRGSTFTLTLPLKTPTDESAKQNP